MIRLNGIHDTTECISWYDWMMLPLGVTLWKPLFVRNDYYSSFQQWCLVSTFILPILLSSWVPITLCAKPSDDDIVRANLRVRSDTQDGIQGRHTGSLLQTWWSSVIGTYFLQEALRINIRVKLVYSTDTLLCKENRIRKRNAKSLHPTSVNCILLINRFLVGWMHGVTLHLPTPAMTHSSLQNSYLPCRRTFV